MQTAYQVNAYDTGNWGPDECYGSYGEWQDDCGRPMYRTQECAEAAVKKLTEALDAGLEISYGWDEVEVESIPDDATADPELSICEECSRGDHDACTGIFSSPQGAWRNTLCQCYCKEPTVVG